MCLLPQMAGPHHHRGGGGDSASSSSVSIGSVASRFLSDYGSATPKKCKVIDAYLVYVFLTGVMQFVYCCLVGTFPFNAFLSGFISCVGSFVLAVCLRLQVRRKGGCTRAVIKLKNKRIAHWQLQLCRDVSLFIRAKRRSSCLR